VPFQVDLIFDFIFTFITWVLFGFFSFHTTVQGKGHLHSCIAGRKDNLRLSILRKDNPKTTFKVLVYQKISEIVRKLDKSVRKIGKSVRNLGRTFKKLGKSIRKLGKSVRK
jgi:hypothetical protein